MKSRREGRFNPKRRVRPKDQKRDWSGLARQVRYSGNPQHKRNPGDFGLTPPADPRPHKTLCDDSGIVNLQIATKLLESGARKGLVSQQERGGWPQNIWAVTDEGQAVEAQLDNQVQGSYHGYPMPESDPLAQKIAELWTEERSQEKDHES